MQTLIAAVIGFVVGWAFTFYHVDGRPFPFRQTVATQRDVADAKPRRLTWTIERIESTDFDFDGAKKIGSRSVFTNVYRSDNGHWQIEPVSTSGLNSPGVQPDGTGWGLLDRTDKSYSAGYLASGTAAQMMDAAEEREALYGRHN